LEETYRRFPSSWAAKVTGRDDPRARSEHNWEISRSNQHLSSTIQSLRSGHRNQLQREDQDRILRKLKGTQQIQDRVVWLAQYSTAVDQSLDADSLLNLYPIKVYYLYLPSKDSNN